VTGSPAGSYTITLSGASDPNYTIGYVSGTLSVTSATLTITALNKTKVYGSVNPTLTYSYAGLVNGDVAPSTLPTTNTAAVTGSPAGSYTITLSGASDPNYTIGYVSGTLSVTKADLTVTATASDKVYDGNKTASVILSSNKLGADVVTLTKTLAEFDTKNVGTGKTVNVTDIAISGADAGNYTLTSSTATGTASITAKLLTITARPHSITYNGTAYTGGNGLVLIGFASSESINNLTGTLTYAGTSQGAKNVGSYTIVPGGLSSPNYNINYVADNLEIKKATLNVTAGNQSVEYGTQLAKILSDAHSNYSGFVGGDDATVISGAVSYLTNYTSSVSAGTTGIFLEPKITGLTSINYDFAAVNGIITITASPNSYFQIPNAFVPGSQNEFDNKFKIIANSSFPPSFLTSFRIFNRAGQWIKTFTGITDSWDGKGPDGSLLASDVYIWVATFVDDPLTKKIPRSGTFILLK
jgi:hypothetical protein